MKEINEKNKIKIKLKKFLIKIQKLSLAQAKKKKKILTQNLVSFQMKIIMKKILKDDIILKACYIGLSNYLFDDKNFFIFHKINSNE